jgi:hypothetical protein
MLLKSITPEQKKIMINEYFRQIYILNSLLSDLLKPMRLIEVAVP